ncbi:hypothetical protein ACFVT5_21335 [Streptomyces sp. NPDC058001]|uniref:hypothetical protein n=1 Tax=Streptomyces sp. NPDC058001 TaxID=3346300 RepID=UPI0036EAD7A0
MSVFLVSARIAWLRARLTVLAAVAAVLTLASCGSGPGSGEAKGRPGSASASPRVPQARPAQVEELALAMGCTAHITTDVDDYRQGVCKTGKAKYVFLSFVSDQGKRDWLDTAQMYGGVYLVGNRWVLSAEPRQYMTAARSELGGTIEETGAFGSSPSSPMSSSPPTSPSQ